MEVLSKLFHLIFGFFDMGNEISTFGYAKDFTRNQMTEITNLVNRYDIKQRLNNGEQITVTLTDGTQVKIKK